jgi:hypothetical protein
MSQLCLYLANDEPLQPGSEWQESTPTHPVVLLSMASLALGSSQVHESKEFFYQALTHLLLKRWALARPRIAGDVVAAALSAALADPFECASSFSSCYAQDCVIDAEVLPSAPEALAAEFTSLEKPQVPLQQLVRRVHRATKCSAECFPIALALLDRYYRSTNERIDKSSAPRLFLVSLLVATKLRDDRFFRNSVWADASGVPLAVLNSLEVKFLCALRYNLFVSVSDYLTFEGIILDTIAQYAEGDEGFTAAMSPGGCTTPQQSAILQQALERTLIGGMCLTPTATPMSARLGQAVTLAGSYDSYGPEGESAQPTPQAAPKVTGGDRLAHLLGQPLSLRPPS